MSVRLSVVGAVLLALSPVSMLPGGIDRFTLPKAVVAMVGAATALTIPADRLPRRFVAIIGVAGTVALLAALLGSQPVAQLLGRSPRFEGVFVGTAYLLAFLAGTRVLSPARPQESQAFVRTWSGASIVVALVAGLEAIGVDPIGNASPDRVISLLGNASDLGAYGVLTAGFLGAVALGHGDRLAGAGALAALASVALSASRGALVGLVVVFVVLVLVAGTGRLKLGVGAAAAVTLVVALVLPSTRARVLGDSAFAGATVSGRFDIWRETWSLLASRPLGVGPSGYLEAIPSAHTTQWYRTQPTLLVLDSPHNLLLQLWSAGGPLLVALAVAGGALLLREGGRWWRSGGHRVLAAAGVAGVVGYVAVLMTHFTSPRTTLIAAVTLGAVLPLARPEPAPIGKRAAKRRRPTVEPRGPATSARPVLVSVATILAVVLGLAVAADGAQARAIGFASAGDSRGADRSFRTAMSLQPWGSHDVGLTALHAYAAAVRNGHRDAAAPGMAWVRETAAAQSGSAWSLFDAGSVREGVGDLAGAARTLDQAQALDPHNPRIMLGRAIVAATAGDLPGAERILLRAVEEVPASPDPWRNLAQVYRLMGDSTKATSAQEQADRLAAALR